MKTLLLIDGHAIIHRAFHALPPLTNRDGIQTNAVYGFFTMLHRTLSDYKPTHLVVCFDTPKPTFRKELFQGYQSKRPRMDDTLKPQIPLIKALLDAGKIGRIEKEGFEADDMIGTLSEKYKKLDYRVLILTGDKDILQLVDDNVLVITPITGLSNVKLYTTQEVINKFFVQPTQIPDWKALAGDPSDNYPGAVGIGPKTAANIIAQFGDVETLYDKIDQLENLKAKQILINSKKNVLLFKNIATIKRDVEILNDVDTCEFKGFSEELRVEMEKLQMNSIIKRFFEGKPIVPHIIPDKKVEKKEGPDNSQLDLF